MTALQIFQRRVLLPLFYLGPNRPHLLSQTWDKIVITYENLNDTHWEYVYNATALSPDNTTHEGACNADSTTCEFVELSPNTEYKVYIQAFVPDYPVGSELSEALIVQTNSEDETGKLKKYNQASAHVWQLKENLATRDTHFLVMIYRS